MSFFIGTLEKQSVVTVMNNDRIGETAQEIYEFEEGTDVKYGLNVWPTEEKKISALISMCGTLITSRVLNLVRQMCLADFAKIKIASDRDASCFRI